VPVNPGRARIATGGRRRKLYASYAKKKLALEKRSVKVRLEVTISGIKRA
jgi:hypothetical protein